MLKNKIITPIILTFVLSFSSCSRTQAADSDPDVINSPYQVTPLKSEFTYGEELSIDSFKIVDKATNQEVDKQRISIEGYKQYMPGIQKIKFIDGDRISYYNLKTTPLKKLNAIIIGNSWGQDTLKFTYNMAKNLGMEDFHFVNMYIGGCDISNHYKYASLHQNLYVTEEYSETEIKTNRSYLEDGLALYDYDFIIFHQAGISCGQEDSFADLDKLKSWCLEHSSNKQVKFAFNMTWAYNQTTDNPNFEKVYNSSQIEELQANWNVMQNYMEKKSYISAIIPNGTAIQNGRTSFIGDNFHRDNQCHLNDNGKMTAGLTFLSKLAGYNPYDMTWCPKSIKDNRIPEVCKESSLNAVNFPYQISESKHR